ncbi:MAG TPA: hypothetical protein VHA11_07965 [Bryobacteraceae bacterium]|nr:hypothetical protein [Bryobacteraceae bacterium]
MGLTVGVLLALSLLSGSVAEKPPRSTCNRETQGRYWPEEANTDRKLAARLMRTGELQMCSRGFFRYNWEPLTINYHSVLAKKQAAGAAPDAQRASR